LLWRAKSTSLPAKEK